MKKRVVNKINNKFNPNKNKIFLIIILLVIAGLIMYFADNEFVLRKGNVIEHEYQSSLESSNVNLEIENVKINDNEQIEVIIKRSSGEGSFSGVEFIVSDGKKTEKITKTVSMNEFEKKIFYFQKHLFNFKLENIKSISVYPVYKNSDGGNTVGNKEDEWKNSEKVEDSEESIEEQNVNESEEEISGCEANNSCINITCAGLKCQDLCGNIFIGNLQPNCSEGYCGIAENNCGECYCEDGFNCDENTCVKIVPEVLNNETEENETQEDEESEEPQCTDICSLLNYECGIHLICNENVYCGSCNEGNNEECNQNGICIVEESGIIGSGDAESLLLAGVPLIHDQVFLIPENAVSGDTVGDLNLMWISPSQSVTFSLVNNDGGRFSMQKLTGRNVVSNHLLNYEIRISVASANFDYDSKQQRQITVRATDSATGKYSDAVITIKLSKTENTIFVDPSWNECHDGTRDCPYDSWDDVIVNYYGLNPGYTYLQKRGTTSLNMIGTYSSGTQSQHITLGAYGTGDRPLFDGNPKYSTWTYVSGIKLGTDTGNTGSLNYPVSYYDIYSLAFENWWAGIVAGNMGTSHCTFTDLYFTHTRGMGIYLRSDYTNGHDNIDILYHEVKDLYSEYSEGEVDNEYGFKTEAGAVEYEYCVARFNKDIGFAGGSVKYSQAYDSGWGIKAHGDDILIDYTLIQDNTKGGIYIGNFYQSYGLSTENVHVKNSLIKDNYEGIKVSQDATGGVIEGVEFSGNSRAIGFYRDGSFIGAPSNFIIKNSEFHDNNEGIRIGNSQSPYPKDIIIAYNLFFDNTGNPITITEGKNINVYNNVFYNNGGSYDMQVSRDELFTARNNLLEDGISASSVSAHVIDHNINYQSSFFVNLTVRDFHLKSGSTPINVGINVGFSSDFDGKSISGNPDIGAFEY